MDSPLTPKVEQLIQERLRQGGYRTATEVIEEALIALEERENREALMAAIQEADEEVARGEFIEYEVDRLHELSDDVKQRGRARLLKEQG